MRRASDLTSRSGSATLPARTAAELVWSRIAGGNACGGEDAWRVIELASLTNLPFAARIRWNMGSAAGFTAQVAVARATRVCIHARALDIDVANFSNAANQVVCGIADGLVSTHNQWEESGTAANGVTQPLQIPPFADRVRLELADPTLLPTTQITVRDGFAAAASVTLGDAQPDAGIPVSGARSIEFITTANVAFRVVYTLRL